MDVSSSGFGFDTLVLGGHASSAPSWIGIRRDEDDASSTALLRDVHPATDDEMQTLLSSFLHASLPPPLPDVEGLKFEALYLSCGGSIIGGDWYDAVKLPDGSVAVSLGDVEGHGVEAAALMGKLRYSMRVVTLRAHELESGGAASILQSVEDGLRSEHVDASATAFLGIISPDRTHMHYATAGHPPPLVVRTSGETSWLESGEMPLGWNDGFVRSDHVVDLTGTWSLILYSDGIIEAGRDIVQGLERLQRAVENPDMQREKDILPRVVEQSLAVPPHDDIAMLAVTFC